MIKKIALLSLLSIFVSSCAVDPYSLSRSYHKLLPATVVIDGNGRLCGVGTVIDKDAGLIYTAAHVAVGRGYRYSIRFQNGSPIPAEIIARDPNCDSAVLRVEPNALAEYKIPKIKFQKYPRVGECVFTIGHPHLYEFAMQQGILTRGTSYDKGFWRFLTLGFYLVDCKVVPGNSGGLVYNTKNEVIGSLVGWTPADGKRADVLTVVIPTYSIMSFLEANNIQVN